MRVGAFTTPIIEQLSLFWNNELSSNGLILLGQVRLLQLDLSDKALRITYVIMSRRDCLCKQEEPDKLTKCQRRLSHLKHGDFFCRFGLAPSFWQAVIELEHSLGQP